MEYVVEKEISQDSINQIVAIAEDYTQDFFTKGLDEYIAIDMRFQRAVLLKLGSEIISFIVFTCLDGSLHITLMATKRTHINKGYGKLLMQYFVEHTCELGLDSIELYTFSPESKPINVTTVEFYQRVGFTVEREHKDLWEKGTVTLKMRKSW